MRPAARRSHCNINVATGLYRHYKQEAYGEYKIYRQCLLPHDKNILPFTLVLRQSLRAEISTQFSVVTRIQCVFISSWLYKPPFPYKDRKRIRISIRTFICASRNLICCHTTQILICGIKHYLLKLITFDTTQIDVVTPDHQYHVQCIDHVSPFFFRSWAPSDH